MSTEPNPPSPLHLFIVDDDEVSREVLCLVAQSEGYVATPFESGDAALAWLHANPVSRPDALLTDLQMPGTTGAALAAALRKVCGAHTTLLAMSGSQPKPEALLGFDGFLLKPFPIEELAAALASRPVAVAAESQIDPATVLDTATYDRLRQMMAPEQVAALFAMFLADAEARLATMRHAVADGDDIGFRRAAHAIKGGCGMVGATEMHRRAAALEDTGLTNGSLDSLDGFVAAIERLRSMLIQ